MSDKLVVSAVWSDDVIKLVVTESESGKAFQGEVDPGDTESLSKATYAAGEAFSEDPETQAIVATLIDGEIEAAMRRRPHDEADQAAAASTKVKPGTPPSFDEYEPLPLDAMPGPLADFAVAASASLFQPIPCLVAFGSLFPSAAAIGATRDIRMYRTWKEPSNLWGSIVHPSGGGKSPAFGIVMKELMQRQQDEFELHEELMRAFSSEKQIHDVRRDQWRHEAKKGIAGDPPEAPEPPALKRLTTKSFTLEALARICQDNPRGVLLARDELSALFLSLGKYNSGGNADLAEFLDLSDGIGIDQVRKGEGSSVRAAKTCVSLFGGVQPGVLDHVFGGSFKASAGLPQRLMWCYPPDFGVYIDPDLQVDSKPFERWKKIQAQLSDFSLSPDGRALTLEPSREASLFWANWANTVVEPMRLRVGGHPVGSALAKMKKYVARIALLWHCIEALEDRYDEGVVQLPTMEKACTFATAILQHTLRVFGLAEGSGNATDTDQLVQRCRSMGGLDYKRMKDLRSYRRNRPLIEARLRELASEGLGKVVSQGRGGPLFLLNDQVEAKRA